MNFELPGGLRVTLATLDDTALLPTIIQNAEREKNALDRQEPEKDSILNSHFSPDLVWRYGMEMADYRYYLVSAPAFETDNPVYDSAGNQLCGFFGINQLEDNICNINSLYFMRSPHQGGSMAMGMIVQHAMAMGAKHIELEATSEKAANWYQSVNFCYTQSPEDTQEAAQDSPSGTPEENKEMVLTKDFFSNSLDMLKQRTGLDFAAYQLVSSQNQGVQQKIALTPAA